jgi:hypothetical protein
MGLTKWCVILAVFALAAGCESGDPGGAPAKPAPTANKATPVAAAAPSTKFGAPLGNSPVIPLSDIVRDTGKYAKKTVKTEGQVTAVCQAAGCWMEIGEANGEAHIKSASGRRARVEGTVLPKPDNGECEQEALEATGKTVKVELDATGVELL